MAEGVHSLHASTPAAANCFDQQRHADFSSERDGVANGCDGATGRVRHACGLSFCSRAQLIAHCLDLSRCWADENYTFLLAEPGEDGALGKKSITGVNSV